MIRKALKLGSSSAPRWKRPLFLLSASLSLLLPFSSFS